MSGVPEAEPVTAVLLAAWQTAHPTQRGELLDRLRVPGAIALRSRYRHLLDPEAPPGPWDEDLSPEQWNTIIRLEREGEEAVNHNAAARAQTIFARLLDLEPSATQRVVTVHAYIGFGDLGLATEDAEAAAHGYEAALELATEDGYRFGRLRALVGLGYLTLLFHSASTALDRFEESLTLAGSIGDPLYAGNAALGIAECRERLGDLDGAIVHATKAYRVFSELGSPMGVGNAAQRLGAMLHRLGRPDEARAWLDRAYEAFTTAGNPMGLTNVLACLGDLYLDQYELDRAEEVYLTSLSTAEEADLPRSRAHALQDLARVARSRGDWATAAVRFADALAAYRVLGELLGMCHAFDKLAEAQTELGQTDLVVRTRMEAIFAVEEYRATHRDERSQREYRERFADTYTSALQASTVHDSAASFAVVADCLAGRRLAGLFAESARAEQLRVVPGGEQLTLLQELLVRADQRLVGRRRGSGETGNGSSDHGGDSGDGARRDRLVQLLGAVGIKHGLVPQAEASLDDLLAAVYLPPVDEGAALLSALPDGCQVLQLLIDPADESLLRWLWRDPTGTVKLGVTTLSAETVGLLALLQGDGDERIGLRVADLAPLTALLPDGLREALVGSDGNRLLLIPVGGLWLVPWSALPLTGDRVLGEAASYVLCPSLTVQRQLADRGVPALDTTVPSRVDLWCSPLVRHHRLSGFREDGAWDVHLLQTSAQARNRLREGSGVMVVTGHGRPVPGLGHYLELDEGEWLLPVDLVGATPPSRLVMVACWGGAIPNRGPTDPVSLTTLGLAGGSAEILATVGELADSVPATLYVERVLADMAGGSLPAALQTATKWLLEHPEARTERIHHWAPLVPFGTFY